MPDLQSGRGSSSSRNKEGYEHVLSFKSWVLLQDTGWKQQQQQQQQEQRDM
jgi:hypothetical protein